MTQQTSEAEYLSADDGEVEFTLPKLLKISLAIVFGVFALVLLALIVRYTLLWNANPSELNLGTALIFCLTAFVLVLIPWNKLGLRLKKVGFVEFEQVIKTQKREQILEIVELQKQINQLKGVSPFETEADAGSVVEPIDGTPREEVTRTGDRKPLLELLQQFLQEYAHYYFSPLRIKLWGAKRDGFHELDSYSKEGNKPGTSAPTRGE